MPVYPILFSFRRCPYAMRARMALAVAAITCELREIVLRNKPVALLTASSKGTVPVLQTVSGKIIDESLDIMRWALGRSDPEKWLNADPTATQNLILMNDKNFKPQLDRYKYSDRFPGNSQEMYRQSAEEFLRILEQRLSAHHGKGLVIDRISLADIAIFPFIRQFSKVDISWFSNSPYSQVKQWLDSLQQGQLFQNIMKKYKPWEVDTKVVLFNEYSKAE